MTRENLDPSQLSFEDSLSELEKIVSHLERGDVPLADSIRIYKRGAALKVRCESQLRDAQLEVDQIVMGLAPSPRSSDNRGKRRADGRRSAKQCPPADHLFR
jgi:exodeoxyribonuclease VII small subunit